VDAATATAYLQRIGVTEPVTLDGAGLALTS
jgi:hypothetical protein